MNSGLGWKLGALVVVGLIWAGLWIRGNNVDRPSEQSISREATTANPPQEPPAGARPVPPPLAPQSVPRAASGFNQEPAKQAVDALVKPGASAQEVNAIAKESLRKMTLMADALKSEESARAALGELEACVKQTNPIYGVKAPAGRGAQAQNFQIQSCRLRAKQVAEKFPSLRVEVNSRILQSP